MPERRPKFCSIGWARLRPRLPVLRKTERPDEHLSANICIADLLGSTRTTLGNALVMCAPVLDDFPGIQTIWIANRDRALAGKFRGAKPVQLSK